MSGASDSQSQREFLSVASQQKVLKKLEHPATLGCFFTGTNPYEAAASVEIAAKDATSKTESDEDAEELLSSERMVSQVLDDPSSATITARIKEL